MSSSDDSQCWKSDALRQTVAAAIASDPRAWNSLVERFTPLVSSVLRRYRLSESDSADASQNVWLALVRNLKNIREPAALPGWIASTTKNEALHVLSARRRTEPVDPQADSRLDIVEHVEMDAGMIRRERHRALRTGLHELRPEHQELLRLLISEPALSYHQISLQLGIPIGSIGPTRARCLRKLQSTEALRDLAS